MSNVLYQCVEKGCKEIVMTPYTLCGKHCNTKKTTNSIQLPSQQENHYDIGGIPTFDILKAKMTKEGFEGFLEGNVIKYTMRHREKGGLNDLIKALDYLQLLIKSKQGE